MSKSFECLLLITFAGLVASFANTGIAQQGGKPKQQQSVKADEEKLAKICPLYPMIFMGGQVGYYAVQDTTCSNPQLWWGQSGLASNCSNPATCFSAAAMKTEKEKPVRVRYLEKADGVTFSKIPKGVAFSATDENGHQVVVRAVIFKVSGQPKGLPSDRTWDDLPEMKLGFYSPDELNTESGTLDDESDDTWTVTVNKNGPWKGTWVIFKTQ